MVTVGKGVEVMVNGRRMTPSARVGVVGTVDIVDSGRGVGKGEEVVVELVPGRMKL